MCGIVGFVSKNKDKEDDLSLMLNRIVHRGPDACGKYIDDDIALGHRRLSIIDLSSGDQPIFNENNSLVIIFNGEIYNYKELREDLVSKDHVFKTSSDTEVLLHGYEEYGDGILDKLRGMFAFVIWDIKNKELFGARDHFGIKPFYYYKRDGVFMFASEIKAFLDHSDFKKELNRDVIPEYLRFNYSPGCETFFKDVYKLEPGHFFRYKNGKLSIKRYFKVSFEASDVAFDDLVSSISESIKDSVKHHMISDVPVGSFLSSGIDSSYLVSLARPDKTYTVGYDIPKYDEIGYAKDLTDKLGINNISKKITKDEYFEVIPRIMYHLDEPLADPAAVALYFVAKLASRDVKVVLSGEGADELFGGYNYYRQDIDCAKYRKIPFWIRRIIGKIAGVLPERRGINFLVRNGQTLEEGYIGVTKIFSERETRKLIKYPNKARRNMEITADVYSDNKNCSNISKMQAIDINFWLARDIFLKADKMTMANSIEGRVPFSDIEVFKLARTIPDKYKVTKDNTKVALRSAAKLDIPNESYSKKKLGFPVPLREWLKDSDVYDSVKEMFNSPISLELFDNKILNRLLDDHRNNKRDNYKKIWCVYCFLVWYDEFFIKN